ncbi:MAG: hypothetical protein QM527_10820 [Alphaproteobacteria bacterium]|nr:hypothetical protein [Alphaproteobacteria bacterium]
MEKDLKKLALRIASEFKYTSDGFEKSTTDMTPGVDTDQGAAANHLDEWFLEKLRAGDHLDFILESQPARQLRG